MLSSLITFKLTMTPESVHWRTVSSDIMEWGARRSSQRTGNCWVLRVGGTGLFW